MNWIGEAAFVVVAAVVMVAFVVRVNRRTPGGWPRVHDKFGREVLCYSFGGFDWLDRDLRSIKYGVTGRDLHVRLAEHAEEERALEWRLFAYGPGGEPREEELLARFDRWRYPRSEMFGATPEVVAGVGEFEVVTREGRRALRSIRQRPSLWVRVARRFTTA